MSTLVADPAHKSTNSSTCGICGDGFVGRGTAVTVQRDGAVQAELFLACPRCVGIFARLLPEVVWR